jgi:hypothetical protein
MAEIFHIKQHDTRPIMRATLTFPEDPEKNLTKATKVQLVMRRKGASDPTAPKVKSDAVIVDKPSSIVEYEWEAADTDTAEEFNAEFEIIWEDGGIETVPRSDYFTVHVHDDLG